MNECTKDYSICQPLIGRDKVFWKQYSRTNIKLFNNEIKNQH